MDLEKLNHWVSLLANIGVIAGIVFLALEIQQNNSLLAAQATNALRQYRADVADSIMSPYVLEATHKYAQGDEVSPAEKSAIFMTALKGIALWEWQYGEYVAGRLDRDYLPIESWKIWYYGKGESPVPFREVWESRRHALNPAFVSFFEANVISH